MPLINCDVCNVPVSDKARQCPRCGRYVNFIIDNSPAAGASYSREWLNRTITSKNFFRSDNKQIFASFKVNSGAGDDDIKNVVFVSYLTINNSVEELVEFAALTVSEGGTADALIKLLKTTKDLPPAVAAEAKLPPETFKKFASDRAAAEKAFADILSKKNSVIVGWGITNDKDFLFSLAAKYGRNIDKQGFIDLAAITDANGTWEELNASAKKLTKQSPPRRAYANAYSLYRIFIDEFSDKKAVPAPLGNESQRSSTDYKRIFDSFETKVNAEKKNIKTATQAKPRSTAASRLTQKNALLSTSEISRLKGTYLEHCESPMLNSSEPDTSAFCLFASVFEKAENAAKFF